MPTKSALLYFNNILYEKKIFFNFHIYVILYFSVLFVPENKNQIQSHFPLYNAVHFSNIYEMNVVRAVELSLAKLNLSIFRCLYATCFIHFYIIVDMWVIEGCDKEIE